ncbi:hypothetical protein P280DRAFT_439960 [Massarina eburnea CBS 473.64]|uniref:DUF6590 domain-containing protein n=1 Tax=Massarina eburnea CBS 473.64 TaxID=1395130 RepID=A0A6A6SGL6_9PLEO|nr:hypothetical protein P280DRAFT_439960 [Massarina eburnea CBS 473.64]
MPPGNISWIWSEQHNDHYYVATENGQFVYHWSRQEPNVAQPTVHQPNIDGYQFRTTGYQQGTAPYQPVTSNNSSNTPGYGSSIYRHQSSGFGHQYSSLGGTTEYQPNRQQQITMGAEADRPRIDSGVATLPHDPVTVSDDVRPTLPDLIHGTPGLEEPLDHSYRVRFGSEAYQFFKEGKVFMMLHIQAASAQALHQDNENITVVKYGEQAFSQIRRFVIMEVRRGFVYACPISTYSQRGTLKNGCIPGEHSVVYVEGTLPFRYPGENLVKAPIAVRPTHNEPLTLHAASRLHFGKVYPIEMNVKVKDLGKVVPQDLTNLLAYYREHNRHGY